MTQVKNVLLNVYEEKLVKNAEKRIFLPFLATRWGRNRSETPVSYTHLTLPTNREV